MQHSEKLCLCSILFLSYFHRVGYTQKIYVILQVSIVLEEKQGMEVLDDEDIGR